MTAQRTGDFNLNNSLVHSGTTAVSGGGLYSDLVEKFTTGNVARFSTSDLIEIIAQETHNAQKKIEAIQAAGSAISISDMFEMQMRMNRLSQYSEMTTAVVSAANSAVSSAARNVK